MIAALALATAVAVAQSSQQSPPKTSGISAAAAAIIGAAVGAGATLITSLVTAVLQSRRQNRDDKRLDASGVTEQLNQLYGPVLLLSKQSQVLAGKLREGKSEPEWHLLDHLAEVVDDEADCAIAEQIVEINRRIEDLISAKAGFIMDGLVPQSFVDFLGHHRFMRTALEEAKKAKTVPAGFTAKQFVYYPKEFDQDVQSAYDALVARRAKLLS